MQRIGILNGTNVTYDHDLTASVLASLNAGIIEGFDVSGSGASANITPGKALIECTRTNGQKVMVYFENTTNVPIDMSGTKKVYILVNQAKLDDGSANALDGTGVASITTNASAYPSGNYVKLYSVSSGTPTDDRVSIKSKLKRVGLTAYRLLLVDANGSETELAFGTTGQILQSNGENAMPIWGNVTASQSNTIVLTGQTIDAGVSAKDPVYFDNVSSSWKKAMYGLNTPTGIYIGVSGEVVLFGKITTTGLTAGYFYYLQDSGGIGTAQGSSKIKIGFAQTSTDFLVDIDVNEGAKVFASNITKGYALGGITTTGVTSIQSFVFSTETSATITAVLPVAIGRNAGVNSSLKGYSIGGNNNTTVSNEIQGIQFSDETAINPSATLSETRHNLTGVNSTIKGYAMGGYNTSTYSNQIDGIQFSDETAINPSASLVTALVNLAGVSSSLKGYALGGTAGSSSNEIQGIQFTDETAINPSASLSVARSAPGSVNSTTKGYAMGGNTTSALSEIDGIQFTDETAINPSASLSVAITGNPAGVHNLSRGYLLGGSDYGGTSQTEIQGIQFTDETAINPSAVLPVAKSNEAGVQNGGVL